MVTAIRFLCDEDLYKIYLNYSRNLLKYFVEKYGEIYGKKFLSYNIHNLIHVCNDVKLLGPLDTFSAFKFENYLYKIKSNIRNNGRPLEQISNRIFEKSSFVSKQLKTYPTKIFSKGILIGLDFKNFKKL